MARITVEDCEKVVPNRFDLVVLAAQRVRQINTGEPITIEVADEKKPVTALREIAAQTVSIEDLKDRIVWNFRTVMPQQNTDDGTDEIIEDDTYDPYFSVENKLSDNEKNSVNCPELSKETDISI